ncbi:MAG: hypothetical protein FWE33_04630 [Defluviitaleaceae bacterium]|nr:hypothetical protein [Defluviitaleaceae bacterium]
MKVVKIPFKVLKDLYMLWYKLEDIEMPCEAKRSFEEIGKYLHSKVSMVLANDAYTKYVATDGEEKQVYLEQYKFYKNRAGEGEKSGDI